MDTSPSLLELTLLKIPPLFCCLSYTTPECWPSCSVPGLWGPQRSAAQSSRETRGGECRYQSSRLRGPAAAMPFPAGPGRVGTAAKSRLPHTGLPGGRSLLWSSAGPAKTSSELFLRPRPSSALPSQPSTLLPSPKVFLASAFSPVSLTQVLPRRRGCGSLCHPRTPAQRRSAWWAQTASRADLGRSESRRSSAESTL